MKYFLISIILLSNLYGENRVWTNLDGRSFQGELIESTDTHAEIVRATDKRKFRVPLEDLSDKDKQFIQSQSETLKEGETQVPDVKAKLLESKAPEYPKRLREDGVEGAVIIGFTVNRQGKASDFKVIESTHDDFTKAVHKVLKSWRYEPAIKDGQPVETRCRVRILFRK